VDCVKAGFLVKADGQWTLTNEGEKALDLPPGQLIRSAWKNAKPEQIGPTTVEGTEQVAEHQAAYEEAKEGARAEIDGQIDNLGAYEFQKLVAELLRAMGYYIAHVAPPGPDGGVDVVAYKDPLGTVSPRVNVQVKHREQKVDVAEVRQLVGTLHKDGDIGLIISSGGFTKEAEREIQSSNKHIEKMDLDRLVNLWQEHYDRVSEAGKALLPLVKVYFLKPAEE
jgi:restriction system protein